MFILLQLNGQNKILQLKGQNRIGPERSKYSELPVHLCQRQKVSLPAPTPSTTIAVVCNALVDKLHANLGGAAQSCILPLTQHLT